MCTHHMTRAQAKPNVFVSTMAFTLAGATLGVRVWIGLGVRLWIGLGVRLWISWGVRLWIHGDIRLWTGWCVSLCIFYKAMN
jgi:hypothetical protein